MQDGTTNWSTVSDEMESVSMAERGSLGQGNTSRPFGHGGILPVTPSQDLQGTDDIGFGIANQLCVKQNLKELGRVQDGMQGDVSVAEPFWAGKPDQLGRPGVH